MSPTVFILLLNYRGADDTLACLDSLKALAYPNYRIVVIDNASGDDSVERLRKRLGDVSKVSANASFPQAGPEFHLIESSENLGFSGGNNLGIRYALEQGADFVWLLNNDTTVDSHALTHLVEEAHRTGSLTGSLILYPDKSYQQVGTTIHWLTGSTRGIPEQGLEAGMEIECLSGASMLIPRRLLQQVGLLEESYFLYFEDGEYCLRARERGFRATLAIRSRVFHKEGATTGRKSLATQYYYHRNRLKLLSAYASPVQKITIALYTMFRLVRSIIKAVLTSSAEKKDSLRVQWQATRDFLAGIEGPCPHPFQIQTAPSQTASNQKA